MMERKIVIVKDLKMHPDLKDMDISIKSGTVFVYDDKSDNIPVHGASPSLSGTVFINPSRLLSSGIARYVC